MALGPSTDEPTNRLCLEDALDGTLVLSEAGQRAHEPAVRKLTLADVVRVYGRVA